MRGSSLVEMIFAMAIIGLTLAFATLATVLIARESMRSIAMLPAENRAQITMDKIRFTLQRAQFRTIVISDNNQRIEFLDPYLSATVKSAIYLSNGRLYYQPSVNSAAKEDWRAVKTIAFALTGNNTLVSTQMTMPARFRGTDILVSAKDLVYIRN